MFTAVFRLAVSTVVLLAVVISAACGGSATPPTSPTPVPQTAATPTPAPPPTRPEPSTGLTPFAGVWELTLTLTDITVHDDRSGCVADALGAEVGVPRDYLLTVTENDVTITNPADNLACTFDTVKGNSEGFTTVGVRGLFLCTRQLAVRCGDQTTYDLMWIGQDISAKVTGTEITGARLADWIEMDRVGISLSTKAEFKGRRR